jgi:acyl carrier protein
MEKKKKKLQKTKNTTDLSKQIIIDFLKKKIKNLPLKNYSKIDLFENSYLDSLKFLVLLGDIEDKFKIKIEFDNKSNIWIRNIDSLTKKIMTLTKR